MPRLVFTFRGLPQGYVDQLILDYLLQLCQLPCRLSTTWRQNRHARHFDLSKRTCAAQACCSKWQNPRHPRHTQLERSGRSPWRRNPSSLKSKGLEVWPALVPRCALHSRRKPSRSKSSKKDTPMQLQYSLASSKPRSWQQPIPNCTPASWAAQPHTCPMPTLWL